MSKFKEIIYKLRRNIAYQIFGFLSYPLVFLFISAYDATFIHPNGVAAIGAMLAMLIIVLLTILLFTIFITIAFLTINKKILANYNIFADIGYSLICILFISILIGCLIIIPGKNNAFEKTKINFESDKVLIQKFIDDINTENKEKYNNPNYDQSSLCVYSRPNFVNCFTKYLDGNYKIKYVVRNKEYKWDNYPKIITKNKSYDLDCYYEFKNNDRFNYKKATPNQCNIEITYKYGLFRPKHTLTFTTDYFYIESTRKHSDFIYEILP